HIGLTMNLLQLKELSQSDLYRRRQERHDSFGSAGLEKKRLRYVD
ncbi:hypothetical protein scyTo_0025004, partial [Scyliorhinus torazame]|nr:hypothetical protein [Scyliorhinus torazame]